MPGRYRFSSHLINDTMDLISQGILGASAAQAGNRDTGKIKAATLLGCLGGLAPDLDILISSSADPLLSLEYHRQFTHALIFIPLGALIVATLTYPLFARQLNFRQAYFYAFLGYATHGLLDACTTYGTLLLWPFTDHRFAWDNISIIDPLFTLPMVALVIAGIRRRKKQFAIAALIWAVCYLSLGIIQRDRAIAAGYQLAGSRGHTPLRLKAKTSFANIVLWKLVYETEDTFHIDAVHLTHKTRIFPGDTAEKLVVSKHFPWLAANSQQAIDIERFRRFSGNYIAIDKNHPNRIIDVRYSLVPNEASPFWAVELSPDTAPADHIVWRSLRRASATQRSRWWAMLTSPEKL